MLTCVLLALVGFAAKACDSCGKYVEVAPSLGSCVAPYVLLKVGWKVLGFCTVETFGRNDELLICVGLLSAIRDLFLCNQKHSK